LMLPGFEPTIYSTLSEYDKNYTTDKVDILIKLPSHTHDTI
jgi:predicted O-linked N-acetylglucosamine transferase (SPINDLY family)